MSKRIVEVAVVLACVGLVLAYGVGVSAGKPSVTAGGSVAATGEPPLCSFSVFASDLPGLGPMVFRGADLYVAKWDQSTDTIEIVKVTSAGISSVFATVSASGSAASNYAFPTDLAFDGSGNLYVAVGNNYPGKYWTVTPGGAVSAVSSGTGRGPSSIEFDSAGNLYITDAFADTIVKNGASFASTSGDLAFGNGLLWNAPTLYALDTGSVQQVSATGSFALVANIGTGLPFSFALQPGTRNFYLFGGDGSPTLVTKVTPAGSPTIVCSLGFDQAFSTADMEFWADGALYISDTANGRVLKLTVPTPAQEVQGLLDQVNDLSLPSGAKNSLTAKLEGAIQSLAKGATDAAKGKLEAFINEVNAKCCVPHPGKILTQSEADALVAAAESLLASLP